MRFYRREELTDLRPGSDQFDQAVELPAASLAVEIAVRVGIKNTVNQFMQIVVHNHTYLMLIHGRGSIR